MGAPPRLAGGQRAHRLTQHQLRIDLMLEPPIARHLVARYLFKAIQNVGIATRGIKQLRFSDDRCHAAVVAAELAAGSKRICRPVAKARSGEKRLNCLIRRTGLRTQCL